MDREDEQLLDLATAVVEGRDIDWRAAERKASTEAERDTISRLQQLTRVARIHRDLPLLENVSSASSRAVGERLESGKRLGPYTLFERIGEGNLGAVYRAEQDGDDERRYALKLIKWEVDLEEARSRFESVRRSMERVHHPGIARLMDLGVTGQGRLFLVSELVEGVPITTYRNGRLPGLGAWMGWFEAVCEMVGDGHEAGILHRTLKPANVLVEDSDGGAGPRLLDIGTATILSQRQAEWTLLARVGQPLDSPAYVAPEEADLSGKDVCPATDVYSLGVLLCELVTGHLPFDRHGPAAPGIAGTRDFVREKRTNPAMLAASVRRVLPAATRRLEEVAAELAGIITAALCRDPENRFGTPRKLATAVSSWTAWAGSTDPTSQRPSV